MALEGIFETKDNKEVFVARFTNGTVKQLEELARFLEAEDFGMPRERAERLLMVLRIGVAWLEKIKEDKEKVFKEHVEGK